MRLFITFLVLFNSISLFSQTQKNSWFINGNAHFDRWKHGSIYVNNVTQLDIEPQIGFCFATNLIVGIQSPMKYFIFKEDKNRFDFGYGTFVRLHFPVDNSSIYFQSSINFFNRKIETEHLGTSLNAGAGIHHFFNKNIAMNIGVDMNFINNESRPLIEYKNNQTKGFAFNFGLEYFFHQNRFLKKEKEIHPPLSERYLKKGNSAIGLAGSLKFKEDYSAFFSWSKFISNSFRFTNQVYINSTDKLDEEIYRGNLEYTISGKWFVHANNENYFSPAISLGTWFYSDNSGSQNDNENGLVARLQPIGVSLFADKGIFDLGGTMQINYLFKGKEPRDLSVLFHIGYESFLSHYTSIWGRFSYNISQNPFVQESDGSKYSLNKMHFNLGFHHFIIK